MQEKKPIEECERWKVTPKGYPFLEEIILHFWIGAGVDVKGLWYIVLGQCFAISLRLRWASRDGEYGEAWSSCKAEKAVANNPIVLV